MSVLTVRDLFNDPFFINPSNWSDSVSMGAYHQQSNENEHIIEVPLVGMSQQNVTVEVVNNVLTVKAQTDSTSRYARSFNQSWNMSKDSDLDNIVAKLENGLLKVNIPRIKPIKKTINVIVS